MAIVLWKPMFPGGVLSWSQGRPRSARTPLLSSYISCLQKNGLNHKPEQVKAAAAPWCRFASGSSKKRSCHRETRIFFKKKKMKWHHLADFEIINTAYRVTLLNRVRESVIFKNYFYPECKRRGWGWGDSFSKVLSSQAPEPM